MVTTRARSQKDSEYRPLPKGRTIAARVPGDVAAALDAFVGSLYPAPQPREVVRYILQDWLAGHGFLKHRDDPEGANGR
jgi:hypothetical protein